ncbi:MAG TPA: DedA family protein [Candidatus Limnocylindria bacterium]|nr:DedA family protein [Candidatus Limnocylindria bacterium]
MLDLIDRYVIPFFLQLYDAVGYVGVAIAIALETFIPIVPSEVIVPMAGWKVAQSAANPSVLEPLTHSPWNFVVALLVATIGAVLGSLAGYLIGAWGGRPLLDRYGRYVHIKPEDLDRADAWFARYGDWAVFLGRLVPLVRALINYPAGVARMPVGRFLLFSALGSLPWNAALLLGGYLLGENYRHLYEAVRPYEYVIYAVVVVAFVYILYRWLRGPSRRPPDLAGSSEPESD